MTQRDPRWPQTPQNDGDEGPTRIDGAAFDETFTADLGGDGNDAFAATMAIEAVGPSSIPALAALGAAATGEPEDDDFAPNERTVPMTADQVVATLERLGADVSGMRKPPAATSGPAQRQTFVESQDNLRAAMALAKTMPETELPLPAGHDAPPPRASRPIAKTVPERAIPATRSVGVQPHQPPPRTAAQPAAPIPGTAAVPAAPTKTPLGLVVAIGVVLLLILAGIAFVVILAIR